VQRREKQATTRRHHATIDKDILPGEEWSFDLITLQVPSLSNEKYVLTSTDKASGYREARYFKTKGEQIAAIEPHLQWSRTQTDNVCKRVRVDGELPSYNEMQNIKD